MAFNPEQFVDRVKSSLDRVSQQFNGLFDSLVGGINRVRNSFQGFVAAANPVVLEQFNLAFRDLQGVIGRILTPSMQKLTEITRALADTIASLSAPIKELLGGLALGGGLAGAFTGVIATVGVLIRVVGGLPLLLATVAGSFIGIITQSKAFQEVASQAREVFAQVAGVFSAVAEVLGPPLVRIGGVLVKVAGAILQAIAPLLAIQVRALGDAFLLIANVLEALTPIILKVVQGITWLTTQLVHLLNQIRQFFGLQAIRLGEKTDVKAGASVGAGVRQANVGDILSVWTGQIERSFANAIGRKEKDTPEKQLDVMMGLQTDFGSFTDKLRTWLLEDLPKKIGDAVRNIAPGAQQAAQKTQEVINTPAGELGLAAFSPGAWALKRLAPIITGARE